MNRSSSRLLRWAVLPAVLFAFVASDRSDIALAHCDSVDGPVAAAVREALAAGRPDAALRWVRRSDEATIRRLFEETLAVRELGPRARTLADRHFLETLVRIHREGEGAPYTGLKAAGRIGPAIAAADESLAAGDVDPLVKRLATRVDAELRERFRKVRERQRRADSSVEEGRAHVAAYVEYVHFVEELHAVLSGQTHGTAEDGEEHR